jgi:thiol-disulfide isomerase/thioredoxin
MINKYLKVSALFLILLLCSCSLSSQQIGLVNKAAPGGIYYPLDQSPRAISAELGKVIVLAFWDSGCHHCQREMPKLNNFAKSFIGSQDIRFIAISVNSSHEEDSLKFTIKNLDLTSLIHAFSGNDISDESFLAFKGGAIPYFVVIDQSGIVRWVGNDAEDVRGPVIKLLRH